MAFDTQKANLNTLSDVGGLVHENFKGKVQPHLEHMGPTLSLFQKAGPGEYTITGEKLVFAGDVTYAGGALATSGELPDHQYIDPVNFETTPTRSYVRRAVDNFNVQRFQGDGTFESFIGRVMEQMWDAFERMQNRHVHGASTGVVAKVSSRTSATVIVLKDGYGHAGANPCMFLEPGMILAWLDATNSFAVGGWGTISSIDYSANTVTFGASIENGTSTPTIAANDLFVFPTTLDDSKDYFKTEYGLAPLGLQDLIDPASANSSYLGVTEATYPRVKPVRRASSDFGEVEIMEFVTEIFSKSQSPVTPSSHTMVAQPAAVIELAKTLIPYTQLNGKGKELPGGWTTVKIGGHDFVEDPYQVPDVIYALCMEDLRVIDLDGDAKIWSGDGSEFSRLADFDGREWYAYHFVQRLLKRRNRCGALTGITVSNSSRYDPTPNY